MKIIQIILSLIFFLLITFESIQAQWTQTSGPGYGIVNALAVSSMHVFAGSNGGLFISNNSGKTWSVSNLMEFSVNSIALKGNIIFAGGGGVYRSSDNGQTWNAANAGLTNTDINCLFVHGQHVFAGTWAGLFVSTNDGNNWSAVNSSLPNISIRSIASDGMHIYASTSNGVFISSDSGVNWAATNNFPTNCSINCFMKFDTVLFAGTSGGLLRSIDSGKTWATDSGISTYANVPSLVVKDTNLFAGTSFGVFRFNNDMKNWIRIKNGLPPNVYIYSLMISDSTLIIGTRKGVYLSNDNGASWVESNSGLSNITISTITDCGSNLLAGSELGVFSTSNNGESWALHDSGMLQSTNVSSLLLSKDHLYAGSHGYVYESNDSGISWTSINSGWTSSDYVLSLVQNDSNLFACTRNSGIYLLPNIGTSWVQPDPSYYTQTYTLLENGSDLFAGAMGGVAHSTDQGKSWTIMHAGLPPSSEINGYLSVYALAAYKGNLYAGIDHSGIYRSTNSGITWSSVNSGIPDSLYVFCFAIKDSTIFAGTSSGVFMSNNGSNWTAINIGLPGLPNIRYLYIYTLLVSGDYLYAGTSAAGIWKRPLADLIPTSADGNQIDKFCYKAEKISAIKYLNSIKISFISEKSSSARLSIFTASGRLVTTIVKDAVQPGASSVLWDGKSSNGKIVPYGVYLCRLSIGNQMTMLNFIK